MPKPEKLETVAELKQRISDSQIAIMTKFIGVNVAQATELRRNLREAGVELKVYKNTLARIALKELELAEVAEYMEGPTAWVFSEDPVIPAKLLKEFGQQVPFVSMAGGILDDAVVSPERLAALADLPTQEQLYAQVVGTIAAPLRNMVGVLNAVPRNLVNVLDQVRKQKEEAGEAA